MTTFLIITTIVSLTVAIVALVIALKKQTVKEVVKTEKVIEHAPVEHPFVFDEKNGMYRLDGDLYVTGSVSALNVLDNNKNV